MGQKVHPYGFRLGITKDWESKWFPAKKSEYAKYVYEDHLIRKEIEKIERSYSISKVEIIRKGVHITVLLHSFRVGALVGRDRANLVELEKALRNVLVDKKHILKIEVIEIKKPEIDAKLLAQSVVQDIEKRVSYKRSMKQAIRRTMRAGALGVKVSCAGRLAGAEIARTEWYREGRVPLQTLNANIDYYYMPALTKFGRIGVKVWVYKGKTPDTVFFEKSKE